MLFHTLISPNPFEVNLEEIWFSLTYSFNVSLTYDFVYAYARTYARAVPFME